MKSILSMFLLTGAVLAFTTCAGSPAAADARLYQKGYVVEGFTITFVYDEKTYGLLTSPARVSVIGEMNGWNIESGDWDLSDQDGDGTWMLDVNRNDVAAFSQFLFMINGTEYQPPDTAWEDIVLVEGFDVPVYNLFVVY